MQVPGKSQSLGGSDPNAKMPCALTSSVRFDYRESSFTKSAFRSSAEMTQPSTGHVELTHSVAKWIWRRALIRFGEITSHAPTQSGLRR